MIIDSHAHIAITKNVEESKQKLEEFKELMKINGIDKSVIMIDPYIEDISCKNNKNHRIAMFDGNKPGEILCKCMNCGLITYSGIDPYIKYNDILFELLKYEKNLYFYLLVSVTKTSMKWLIDYYLEKYGKLVKGIKAYTGLSGYNLDDVSSFVGKVPMLVHCGIFDNQNPSNMINFIKSYENYFQLAHFAALNIPAIKQMNHLDNTIIDIAPSKRIYDRYIKRPKNAIIFDIEKYASLDDLYTVILENVDITKVVWGSDYPFSSHSLELNAFTSSNVFTQGEKEKILCRNMKRVLNEKR
ncbi:MAG: hypothetical protein GX951_03500 [Mollicutes bacterium]|nr:hypothetical protein [Mollicutes bacterium]